MVLDSRSRVDSNEVINSNSATSSKNGSLDVITPATVEIITPPTSRRMLQLISNNRLVHGGNLSGCGQRRRWYRLPRSQFLC